MSVNLPPRHKATSTSQDFVSSDVNEALQEARRIVTNVKPQEKPNQHVIEESTTVQVKNTGNRSDPVEVVISRSTIVSHDSEEEIIASLSDSDLPRSNSLTSTHSCRRRRVASSDHDIYTSSTAEDMPLPRQTKARYRRRHDELWQRDEDGAAGETRKQMGFGSSDEEEDEARLEVNVKEECIEEEGGHLVVKTWEARWTVQHFDLLPEWLQDNEYLRTGHRPPLPSFVECFKSILSLHTETGNIWTHLIGCVAFFCLALWFLTRPDTDIRFQEKMVFSFFFAGAIVCLGLSFMFHTLACHSVNVVKIFSKLDYMGISLLIIGSFIPWIYYGFYCRREPKVTYIAMVVVLGLGAIVVSLWDKFSESRYRPLRAGVFVTMGLSGIVPAAHFIYTDGMRRLIDENGFYWLLTMAILYLVGALLYATRTPERFFPGKFDIWFQSHQLFHTCVVCAAFVHYYGISEMAMKRLTSTCGFDEMEGQTDAMAGITHTEL